LNFLDAASLANVRLKLAQNDAVGMEKIGLTSVPSAMGPSAAIHMGLELEDLQ
jgi:hypothetical protein